MEFEVIGEITDVEVIAVGQGIRELQNLRRLFGQARWRKLKGVARVRLHNGQIRLAEIHWYEAHGIGRRKLKLKRFLEQPMKSRFLLCINDGGAPEALETRKFYEVLEDPTGAAEGLVRIIDESGEDYLYPQEYFLDISLPSKVEEVLAAA